MNPSFRLIGALLIEFDEKWLVGTVTLIMAELDPWLGERAKDTKTVTRIG